MRFTLVCSLTLTLHGCLTPPALMPADRVDYDLAIGLYVAGTERVEIPVEGETVLRGFFVPADEGAPVVLHLLESSGSAASLKLHCAFLAEQLVDVGFASLFVDYAGIGASGGEVSLADLARDARAMWDVAVERAGDPSRVVLRGTSIGTLAAAHLLAQGVEPAGTILIAPVRGETAVRRFASYRYNGFVGWLADLVYADASDVDLAAQLAREDGPLLVVSGTDDLFLSSEERDTLREASAESWRERDGTHVRITIEAHTVLPEEIEFLRVVFPDHPDGSRRAAELLRRLPADVAARFSGAAERARLEAQARFALVNDPKLIAAAALGNTDPAVAGRFLWVLRDRALPALAFDDLVDAVSLEDPAGTLPVEWIEEAGFVMDVYERFGAGVDPCLTAPGIAKLVHEMAADAKDQGWGYSIDLTWDTVEGSFRIGDLWRALRAAGLDDSDARRQSARILLKAARIPDRVRSGAGGTVALEVRDGEEWRSLDLENPEPPPEGGVLFRGSLFASNLGTRARELVRSAEQ